MFVSDNARIGINATCIYLILANQEDLFSNSNTCEVGYLIIII